MKFIQKIALQRINKSKNSNDTNIIIRELFFKRSFLNDSNSFMSTNNIIGIKRYASRAYSETSNLYNENEL